MLDFLCLWLLIFPFLYFTFFFSEIYDLVHDLIYDYFTPKYNILLEIFSVCVLLLYYFVLPFCGYFYGFFIYFMHPVAFSEDIELLEETFEDVVE